MIRELAIAALGILAGAAGVLAYGDALTRRQAGAHRARQAELADLMERNRPTRRARRAQWRGAWRGARR